MPLAIDAVDAQLKTTAWDVAWPLLLFLLLPLVLGCGFRVWWPDLTPPLAKWVVRVAILCLLFNLNFTLVAYWSLFVESWGTQMPPPTVSLASTDALIPTSDRTTPGGMGPASAATAATVAAQGVITVTIGTAEFSATLADTETARAFADRLPLTVNMRDVNSNEKAVRAR